MKYKLEWYEDPQPAKLPASALPPSVLYHIMPGKLAMNPVTSSWYLH